MSHIIFARFDLWNDEDVACFDPTKIVDQLKKRFPNVEVEKVDYADRDEEEFTRLLCKTSLADAGRVNRCLDIAGRLRRRRGPIWKFRFIQKEGVSIYGLAERRQIQISSQDPIPGPLGTQFREFLQGLLFEKPIVGSYRRDGRTRAGKSTEG